MTMDLEQSWHELKFAVRRSIRYHQRRRAFLDRLDQCGNFAGVVFGSAAIIGIMGEHSQPFALVAAALVTVLSAINLVFGTVQKARLHADLARRFVMVEKSFIQTPTPELLRDITEQRLTIEADEPPVFRVLDCMCHADQMRAEGYDSDEIPIITFGQRTFAHVFDWNLAEIKTPSQTNTQNKVQPSA